MLFTTWASVLSAQMTQYFYFGRLDIQLLVAFIAYVGQRSAVVRTDLFRFRQVVNNFFTG